MLDFVLRSSACHPRIRKSGPGGRRKAGLPAREVVLSDVVDRERTGQANGLRVDLDGTLLVCEPANRQVTAIDQEGRLTILADRFEGQRFNSPNDLWVEPKGGIYFSDPRYLGHEPIDQPVQAVYRIDPDGSIHRIITDAGKPNGVCVSPDQKSLYVVSNDNGNTGTKRMHPDDPAAKGRMALLAYDLASEGTAKFREMLVDYAPEDGPDGLVVDADGNLYVAVRDVTRPGIVVYSPKGKELAYIPTPVVPTNAAFGHGKEINTLYVTYGGDAPPENPGILAKIKVERDGYHLPKQ